MTSLMFREALELAELVRAGQVSATELVEESLGRIAALNPTLNAFAFLAPDEARSEAARVGPGDPRPFAGVPIAIKDNRAVRGMPMTMGSDLFGDFTPSEDAFLVRRLREAGFIIVGKTTLPEMGILPTTEPRRHGPTRNPWNVERTPGGSSGGAAAAVAAGMVPVAHGNDGGGSIRIPAACCGLVGLKGARGRVSPGPAAGQSFLTVDGVLTRTVADTAAILDVMAGYEPGDANWAPPPPEPFAESAQRHPGGLRIGLAVNPPLEGAKLDPECERAAREAAMLLESLGHSVEEVAPPWSRSDLLPDFTRAFGPHISTAVLAGSEIKGSDPTEEDVEPLTWQMWRGAQTHDVMSYLSAIGRLERFAREMVSWLSRLDVVLTPALALRPVPIGEVTGVGPDPWGNYRRSGFFTPYTAICNVTGLPAIALPLYEGGDGMPLAVQLIGRPVREGELLGLAAQLEQALPWSQRRPAMAQAG